MDDYQNETGEGTVNETLLSSNYYVKQRAVNYALTAVWSAVALYFVVAQIVFECKRKQKCSINHLCLATSVMALLATILTYFDISFGQYSAVWCEVHHYMTITLYSGGQYSILTLLWFRQHTFYTDPLLKHYTRRTIRWFSAAMIVIISIPLLIFFLLIMQSGVAANPVGCVVTDLNADAPDKVVMVTLVAIYVIVQLILLGLVIYPLTKQQQLVGTDDLGPTKKRLVLCTVVCISSTIISSAMFGMASSYRHIISLSLIANVDLLVCSIALVCSFANWRDRVLPWYYKPKKLDTPYNSSHDSTIAGRTYQHGSNST